MLQTLLVALNLNVTLYRQVIGIVLKRQVAQSVRAAIIGESLESHEHSCAGLMGKRGRQFGRFRRRQFVAALVGGITA